MSCAWWVVIAIFVTAVLVTTWAAFSLFYRPNKEYEDE
jgi:hypothetical protein